MTFIDVVVGVALFSMVFVGLFTASKLSADLVSSTKARVGAVSLASDQVERARSLPYSAVGVIGGNPPGNIPAVSLVTMNGFEYSVHTTVSYGGTTPQFKYVHVDVFWTIRGHERSFSLATIQSSRGD